MRKRELPRVTISSDDAPSDSSLSFSSVAALSADDDGSSDAESEYELDDRDPTAKKIGKVAVSGQPLAEHGASASIQRRSRQGCFFDVELKRSRHMVRELDCFSPNDMMRFIFGLDVFPQLSAFAYCSRPVIVRSVIEKGPAFHDGRIRVGDRVTSMNGHPRDTLSSRELGDPDGIFIRLPSSGNLLLRLYRKSPRVRDCPVRLDLGESLLRSTEFSDIVFAVKGRELPARKFVVVDRSPVLSAMIRQDLKGEAAGRVLVTNFEPAVIETMLRFMYTGYLEPSVQGYEHVLHVAQVADKYQVKGLVDCCRSEIFRMMNVSNAVDLLVAPEGCRFSEGTSRQQMLTFVAAWIEETRVLPSWSNLDCDPASLSDLLGVVCSVNEDRLCFLKEFLKRIS